MTTSLHNQYTIVEKIGISCVHFFFFFIFIIQIERQKLCVYIQTSAAYIQGRPLNVAQLKMHTLTRPSFCSLVKVSGESGGRSP